MTPSSTDGLPPPLCPVRDDVPKRVPWNSTPSINRLPTKLLLRIFAACCQPTSFVKEDPRRTHLRRTVLLLVCRRWRDFIESTPTLWTFVSPHTPPHLYDLLLSRATGAGLDFSFNHEYRSDWPSSSPLSPVYTSLDLPDGEDDQTIRNGEDSDGEREDGHSEHARWIDIHFNWTEVAGAVIAAQSKRTRSLALVDTIGSLRYTSPFFEALFQDRTWPILTDLSVPFTYVHDHGSPARNAEFLSLTPARFPRLQHLTLDMVLPIEPTLFPQLKTLNLTGPTVHWPPVEDFLLCLSQSPRLEELFIRRKRPGGFQDGPAARHYPPPAPTSTLQLPLTLPRLRSLGLGAARHEEVMLLLQAFPFARADLNVTGLFNEDWRHPPANVDLGRCLSIIDAFFPERGETTPIPFPRSVQRLSVCANQYEATIKGLADDDPPTTLFEWSASSTRESLDGAPPSHYDLTCSINDVITLFRGSPLRRIRFSSDDVGPADGQWHRLFAAFPTLEHLEVVGDGTPIGLLHALTPTPSLSNVADSGPCRALRELSCFVRPPPETTEAIFLTMIECLRARARHGMHPLRQVGVHVPMSSYADPEERFQFAVEPYLEELRELVEGEVDFGRSGYMESIGYKRRTPPNPGATHSSPSSKTLGQKAGATRHTALIEEQPLAATRTCLPARLAGLAVARHEHARVDGVLSCSFVVAVVVANVRAPPASKKQPDQSPKPALLRVEADDIFVRLPHGSTFEPSSRPAYAFEDEAELQAVLDFIRVDVRCALRSPPVSCTASGIPAKRNYDVTVSTDDEGEDDEKDGGDSDVPPRRAPCQEKPVCPVAEQCRLRHRGRRFRRGVKSPNARPSPLYMSLASVRRTSGTPRSSDEVPEALVVVVPQGFSPSPLAPEINNSSAFFHLDPRITPSSTDGLPPPLCPVHDDVPKRVPEMEEGEAAQGEKPKAWALQVARGDERCAAWNSTPSINRLPTELLLHIFAACCQPTSFAKEDPRRTHLRRTVLLLVCRRWRDFIESTPTLWTFVSPHTPPHLYDLLLSRAGGAGLDFSFKYDERSDWRSSSPLYPDYTSLDLHNGVRSDGDEDGDSPIWPQAMSPEYSPQPASFDLPDGETDQTISDGEDGDGEDGDGEDGDGDGDGDGEKGDGHSEQGWIVRFSWSEVAGAAIAAQSNRTRSLALVNTAPLCTFPFFKALFQDKTWPILMELSVEFTDMEEDTSPARHAEFLSLTPALFPRLQHLTLNMVLPIEPTLFPRLKTLNLIGPTAHWPPLEDFLVCLSQSPQLETLRIRQEFNMSRDGPAARHYPPPAPTSTLQLPLRLPRLRSLSLGAVRHEEVMLLLQAFPLARADLDVTGLFNKDWRQPPAHVDPGRCLSIVDAFFPDRGETMPIPFPRSMQRLFVYACSTSASIRGLADDDPPTPLFQWSASLVPPHTVRTPHSRYDLPCGINDIVTLFRGSPLRRVQFYTFDSPAVADGQWHRLFAAFPTLEHLELHGNEESIDLFHALTPAPSPSNIADGGPGHALRELSCDISNSPVPGATEAIYRTLVECLRARERRGMHPLRQVNIYVWTSSEDRAGEGVQFEVERYLEELRELVEVGVEVGSRYPLYYD
ncbi:uncharacterized protein BXZ73DRAFT_106109 [Epithele typhae]|uniref:uncharacterized protein n=1 Tax=Epithele typhae TaxID=378194 RepID=UPI0020076778|nr:uncharacterized protein BXZ73DRAFT_106109 [Epithele typhae]KAH9915561.1 hypothetical protein BXZ73DRAFT_106109 [Epithele typhae]